MNSQISEPVGIQPTDARLTPDSPPAPNHSPTHRFDPFRWLGDPGRLDRQAPARGIFERLEFWKVRHQLRDRLAPYEATDASPMFWRGASWTTLKYWAMLIDEDDAGLAKLAGIDTELPDPVEWFART